MLKFTIKVSDKKDGNCKVVLDSPKKEEFEKAKECEKTCAIMIQQKITKGLEELQNE